MCKSQYESPSSIVYKSGDESAAMYITTCPVCMPLTLALQITHCKTCYIQLRNTQFIKVFRSHALYMYANLAMLFCRGTLDTAFFALCLQCVPPTEDI